MINALKRNRFIWLLNLSLLFSGIAACELKENGKKQITNDSDKQTDFSYDLKNPDAIYRLPKSLGEISGISYLEKDKIACIQDEKAIIYVFDLNKAKVISEHHFGKDGDFEDIAIVNNDAFALRSDGTLFKVENFLKKGKKTIKIKTSLSQKNDTEGLVYDQKTNSLYIACKASPSMNKENIYKGFKAIYRFDLKTKALIEKPVFLIDLSSVDNQKYSGVASKFFTETAIKLKLSDGSSFYPSGIAIHPLFTENIFVISNNGKVLIVMNKLGDIIEIHKLDKLLFAQPEGISFSENGDLFISNEGKNGTATLLKFKANQSNRIKPKVDNEKN